MELMECLEYMKCKNCKTPRIYWVHGRRKTYVRYRIGRVYTAKNTINGLQILHWLIRGKRKTILTWKPGGHEAVYGNGYGAVSKAVHAVACLSLSAVVQRKRYYPLLRAHESSLFLTFFFSGACIAVQSWRARCRTNGRRGVFCRSSGSRGDNPSLGQRAAISEEPIGVWSYVQGRA